MEHPRLALATRSAGIVVLHGPLPLDWAKTMLCTHISCQAVLGVKGPSIYGVNIFKISNVRNVCINI